MFVNERGKSLGSERLTRLFKRHRISAVPHGFRSSLRDWAPCQPCWRIGLGGPSTVPVPVRRPKWCHVAFGWDPETGEAELDALGATVQLSAQVLDQNGQAMAGATATCPEHHPAQVPNLGDTRASGRSLSFSYSTGSSVQALRCCDSCTVPARRRAHEIALEPSLSGATGDGCMSRYRILTFVAATLSATLWAYACGDGATEPPTPTPDPPRPTTVTVTPATTQLTALGATVQLSAEVRDQNGQVMAGPAVTWSSSATAVATVSGSGLVTAAGNGTATITATAGAVSGSAAVTVAQMVSSVTVSPTADTLVEGDTLHLSAAAVDAGGHAVTGAEFEWASTDTLVALVDDSGLVTGVAAGEGEITATSSGVTGRAQVTVVAPVPTTVTVTPDSVVFTAIGQTEQLSAEVRDQIGRAMVGVAVSWSSSDTTVAAVDSAGLVTAAGIGVTAVTATVGEVSGVALVTVEQSAGSVIVSPPADTIAPGDTLRLVAEAHDANGHRVESARFSWSSSDVSVATVDASGLVHGVAEGTATIRATAGDARGTAEITVEHPDRAALVALYHANDGPNWVNNDNWLADAPLRAWYGVRTYASGRVQFLDLPENNLSGPIPPEIGNLAGLRQLTLNHNALSGPIPPEIGSLIGLEGLSLGHNNLDGGPIPLEFANLIRLERLQLDIRHCAPPELRPWLRERRIDILPCTDPGGRLLPRALLREDSDGLSLALDDDLRDPLAVTVSDRAVVAASVQAGWLVLSPLGTGEADVDIVPSSGGATATATVVVRAAVGTFGIDIVMEQPVTEIYAETITAAADWWSSVLNGTEWEGRDAREYCEWWERGVPVTASGNDLVIWATRETDPSYSAGASAGTCRRGEGSATEPSHYYPVAGRVTTNARVPHFFGNVNIMRHELGHVLGLTDAFPPATGLVTENRRYFVGSRAVAAFREGGGDPGLPGIPMDGPHWTGDVHPELMISAGPNVPDELSVAALADAGYTVDISKTTPWSSGASAVAAEPVHDVVIRRR